MADNTVWMMTKRAACHCGVSPTTLKRMRRAKLPPTYYLRAGTSIAYKREDLDEWLAGVEVKPENRGTKDV